ncbi:hypothetical protein I79_008948 [Cricetulus griseus]|uniref:Uncharacterized protein n=1 Tax=Cricetulus griseus TaxID=10029 RepID=G3HEG4_CRIGR|nr:hypothetical protein I79_008948 [Cricetulus griseus]
MYNPQTHIGPPIAISHVPSHLVLPQTLKSSIKGLIDTPVTINLFAKSRLSPPATSELYASQPPELGPNEYTERLVLVTKLLGQ